ncbi:amino acid ABC transporter ATP-binding protein [uncultured Ruminococcus sp.]|uniref:amino acid ABC transporter ATP-binding protein n=1 Tax=uncultured Ruminococcus sp. TaxID=165186 RepID=UPI0025EEFABD|nr:amino acid ABC transporter ATP-binding protein [uncultured Ruminococcus sp.]
MKLLEIKNLRKSFDDLEVLKDISLDVSEGQVVSILGPSGSGKSTLLRCMSMLETVDGGSMIYCGKPAVEDGKYRSKGELKEIKSSFSLVFQSFNLFPHYTVMKNICDAPIHVMKRDKKEVTSDGEALLKKMGLADKADYYPYQLSGGQQQRVAIARALNMKPKMLFFDEPTSALDPELTAEILKVLKELAEEKMTMVIVTHEIAFARSISDKVIFMDGGLIVEEGAPADVIDHPSNDRTRAFLKKLEQ